jgi:hypothetical protein
MRILILGGTGLTSTAITRTRRPPHLLQRGGRIRQACEPLPHRRGRATEACELLRQEQGPLRGAAPRCHRRGDFPGTVIRPAQTYGEGGTLVSNFGWGTSFLDRMRKGKRIIVHGDGSFLWCACHIDDCARAFVGAVGGSHTFGKAYHVTGEEWMTWNRYHECTAEAMAWPKPHLVHIPTDLLARAAPKHAGTAAENLQFNNIFDNSAAPEDLGFRYTIPFADGARRTIRWLESRRRIEDSDRDDFYDHLLTLWGRVSGVVVNELKGMEV